MHRRSNFFLGVVLLLLAACAQPTPSPTADSDELGGVNTILSSDFVTIEQTDASSASAFCGYGSGIGQTFTATATGRLVSVALAPWITPNSSPVSNVTLTVRAADRVTVLHSQTIANFADSGRSLVTYPLTTPVPVVAGQVYAFDVNVTCSAGLYNPFNNAPYPDGSGYLVDGQVLPIIDFAFRVVIDPKLDTTVPTKPPAFANSSSARFEFSGTSDYGSAVTGFECSLDGGGFAACPSPSVFTGLGEGNHLLKVRAVDADGSVDPTPTSYAWMVDTVAPTITLVSRLPAANGAGWNSADVTVTWNCTDGLSGVVSSTVSRVVNTQGSSQSATGTCTDNAGNTASNTQTGINIDKTAPTLSPSVSPNPVLRNLAATATPNASDGLSGLASSSCPAVSTSSLGVQSITCTATDRAGNTATSPASYTVLSSSQALSSLISQTQNLPALSFINRSLLLATLGLAQTYLNNGVRSAAVTQLNIYINQVNGTTGISGGPTSSQAANLINQANLIIQSINAGG